MSPQVKLGNAFGTTLAVHISWLWVLPFAVITLVWFEIEPLFEAIMASLLMLASVIAATLARCWSARRAGLEWQQATLFLLGAVVQRTYRSTPWQEAQVAGSGLVVKATLASVFGALWYMLPNGALGVEMEIVALFNLGLLMFSLLLRLSPNHDNLLHAALASVMSKPWPHYTMTFIHSLALIAFAVSSVLMIGLDWFAFGWWFVMAAMLSQLTTVAEAFGEYRTDLISAEPTQSDKIAPQSITSSVK